jgi:hypothetical protein
MKSIVLGIVAVAIMSAMGSYSYLSLMKVEAVDRGVPPQYLATGNTTGTASAAVSKEIEMKQLDELSILLTASGGNFGSKFLIVQASANCQNYFTVDNITLSTATTKGVEYSGASKATTVPVNPAVFPCVKAFTSAGNTGVTETITYSAR